VSKRRKHQRHLEGKFIFLAKKVRVRSRIERIKAVWAWAREFGEIQTLCRSLEIFAEKVAEVEDKSDRDGVMLKKKSPGNGVPHGLGLSTGPEYGPESWPWAHKGQP
jgi:hypothetical protein